MAFTLPIQGLDASPIRPVAIEPLEACGEMVRIFSGPETGIVDIRGELSKPS
jgi:hypothetical protein